MDEQDKQRYLDLYKTNPRRARIVCDGDWGVAEGLVFDNFDVTDFDYMDKIRGRGATCYGMDFGFTHDPTTLISSVYDEESKELWIYDEVYKRGMVSDDIAREVKNRNLTKATIIADSASPMAIEELKRKGLRRITPMKKGKDSILTGVSFMQGIRIHIHPSCKNTIEEFNTYAYQQDKLGNWLNEPVDKSNHAIDAIRYSLSEFYAENRRVKAKMMRNPLF